MYWTAKASGDIEDREGYGCHHQFHDLAEATSTSLPPRPYGSKLLTCHHLIKIFISKEKDDSFEILTANKVVTRNISRMITSSTAIIVLLVPIVLLNIVQSVLGRFVIIFVASAIFVTTITVVSNAKMVEVLAAGAAYAAVMVVFVSGNGIG